LTRLRRRQASEPARFHLQPAVREDLWGITPLFPQNTFFYQEIQKITTVRDAEPALRYGRFYFRPFQVTDFSRWGTRGFPHFE
jgi:hypothetical protein